MSQKWLAAFSKQIRKGGMFLSRILIVLSILAPNVSAAAQAATGDINGRLSGFEISDAVVAPAGLPDLPVKPGKDLAAEMPPGLRSISFAILQKDTVRPLEDPPPPCDTNDLNLVVISGTTCILEAGTYTYTSITIENGGIITLTGNTISNTGVTLIVTDSLTVEAGGKISADAQGYQAASGPEAGAGVSASNAGSGAGHGGWGSCGDKFSNDINNPPVPGGQPYDSVYEPTMLGSGGGNETDHPSSPGGAGAVLSI